jgi:glycosyltransferase involved in cell wall biosynthesis
MSTDQLQRPLRALIVMPVGSQRGGAELQMRQLIEHRGEAGLEPTVAFLRSGPMTSWCAEQGIPAVTVEAGRLRQLRMLGGTVRALVKLAAEGRSQVVVGWMAKGQVYGGLAAASARLPSVWLQPGLTDGLATIDRAATLLPARMVVTNSRNTDSTQRKLLPRRPTTVVYPAVDTARFDAARVGDQRSVRRRLNLPEDGPIFGSVGRLNSWKGFHVLLEAAPSVFERHPEATLVLVGGTHELEPSYADRLRDQAVRVGRRGRVLLVGHQENSEEWMQAMDVFVHTSKREPFGMVVIEAMALGKPVIAGADGGPTEIITPGVNGLLSPYGDVRALATAILDLLDDDERRRTIGAAARRRAGDFTVQQFARQFGAALADAVTRGA